MTGGTSLLSTNLIGTVLLGRYRIVRELAKGGMGVVYLARAEGAVGFVKPVVIKLVLPEHAGDERFLSMFAREAQILSKLRHASIVDVVEFGEQDGAYVMVLEYVRGYHLGQWSKYLRLKGRSVPADIALQVMMDVLDALDHAHSMVHPDGSSMHIVHRDVSPSNVLLDEDGRARLLDFGVARMRGGDFEYQTQVKGFVGKLIYSAPEIFAEGDATPNSDCYSCAVVLHETLLGRNTFRADSQAGTLNRVLNHAPEPLEGMIPDVPTGLDAVLAKALAKTPEQRFTSAHEFSSALRALSTQPENHVRASLSGLLKHDFGREMAELLGLESLADRDEAWRRLSHRTSSAPPPPGPDAEATTDLQTISESSSSHGLSEPGTTTLAGTTSVEVRRGSLPPRAPSPVSTLRPAAQLPGRGEFGHAQVTDRAARTTVSPQIAWALLLLSAAFVGIGALVFGGRIGLVRENAPPQIRVVSSTAAAPSTKVLGSTPGSAALAAPPQHERPEAHPRRMVDAPAQRPARQPAESGSPEARRLTRAFRKQQPRIEACFIEHAERVPSRTPLPAMQLEFDLAADGKLSAVRVTPEALALTALGQCLHAVASATRFPAQGKPSSFSIPLLSSREQR